MSVRHRNEYTGRIEILDNPLSDCACKGCSGARRREQHNEKWHSGTVDGESARVRQEGTRTEALWGGSQDNTMGDDHGHIVTNDGLNAASVRYPGEKMPSTIRGTGALAVGVGRASAGQISKSGPHLQSIIS